ncbi:MAG TPA: glycoside hydrolase family 3 N-terminal domain-containing protein [Devosiaceae bacterium]|nr:glycoside hydrolase family 3 N-terminal domain-containing protein [Devosiaceae bacterium]
MRTLLILLAVAAASVAAVPARAASPSLAEMAGQMIIVGFKGDNVSDASIQALRQEIAKGQIGGVMYLKPNVKSLAAVKAMNLAFKAAHPGLPPFITLDQEGGKVQRLTAAVGFPEMPSAADVARGTPEAAAATYAKTAAGLADLGFNVNFGPVVDLNVNPNNPIIGKYGRSFGTDPAAVTRYAEAFIAAHHEAGILTALKHFPGHGSSTTDSHKGFVDVSATWKPVELAPYKNLISDTQLDFVMVGHLLDNAYGPAKSADPMPSSLSPAWIGKVLRTDLGFKGVVISDDLEMGAIRDLFKPASNAEIIRQTVIQAVNAGVNVLLFSNTAAYDAKLGEEIQQVLVDEGTKDPAFARKIEASYQLIVALKSKLKPA